jgi:hypothetical protein
MVTLQYQQHDFFDVAWATIDQGQLFEVVITGRKRKTLSKVITMYLHYTVTKRKGHPNKLLLVPLALYGIPFPAFCGVLIHASAWRVEVRVEEPIARLIVSFTPGAA